MGFGVLYQRFCDIGWRLSPSIGMRKREKRIGFILRNGCFVFFSNEVFILKKIDKECLVLKRGRRTPLLMLEMFTF